MEGKCEICGQQGELKPFIKSTYRGLVRFMACVKCIDRLT